jgi:retinoblastoma-like protein 1
VFPSSVPQLDEPKYPGVDFISLYLLQIAKLAAIRIRSLCEKLQLSQQLLEQVYSLVQQVLTQKTDLFFNRHIDQIILCSIYGISKA